MFSAIGPIELAVIAGLVGVLLVAVVAIVVLATRRHPTPLTSRDDITALGDNQRLHGDREHGQTVNPHRSSDRGGWV